MKRRDEFVHEVFEETGEDYSLLVSCAFSGKKDMCKKSLDIERLQYYQSTVYMVFHLSPFSVQNKIS